MRGSKSRFGGIGFRTVRISVVRNQVLRIAVRTDCHQTSDLQTGFYANVAGAR